MGRWMLRVGGGEEMNGKKESDKIVICMNGRTDMEE